MRQDVLRNAEKYTKVHKRQRLRHRVVTVLAGVVVFCTTYALILPLSHWKSNVTSRSTPTRTPAMRR